MTNEVNTARLVRVTATVPEICMHNVKLGPGCFCPHCPTAVYACVNLDFEVKVQQDEPGGNRCFACGHSVPALSPEMQQRLDTALAAFGPMATIHAPGCAILSAAGNPKCSCGAENRTAE